MCLLGSLMHPKVLCVVLLGNVKFYEEKGLWILRNCLLGSLLGTIRDSQVLRCERILLFSHYLYT